MRVSSKSTDNPDVIGPKNLFEKTSSFIRPRLVNFFLKRLLSARDSIQSISLLPTNLSYEINKSQFSIVNLHWICNEMVSIGDLSRIQAPIVWTLHDMWPFCGAQHYVEGDAWINGFDIRRGSSNFFKPDIDRWTWNRKYANWKRPMNLVAPSNWMSDCIKKSKMMMDWPVTVIPNPIDVNVWKPYSQNFCRDLFGLPLNRPIMLFGAAGGQSDPRKGYDLLSQAIPRITSQIKDLQILVLGQSEPKSKDCDTSNIRYMGNFHDDVSLALLLSAVDVVAIPSRQDNLPNIGIEASACGVPVVAFDVGGISDIVDHGNTGFLVKAFDIDDFAAGTCWVLSDEVRLNQLKIKARLRAIETWSYERVAKQYLELYRNLV